MSAATSAYTTQQRCKTPAGVSHTQLYNIARLRLELDGCMLFTYLGLIQSSESFQQVAQVTSHTVQVLSQNNVLSYHSLWHFQTCSFCTFLYHTIQVIVRVGTYWVILQCGYVGLYRLLQVTSSNKSGSQVYITVDKLGFELNSMPVVLQRFFQLPSLFEYVTQI